MAISDNLKIIEIGPETDGYGCCCRSGVKIANTGILLLIHLLQLRVPVYPDCSAPCEKLNGYQLFEFQLDVT
jgi:hypothetical protein